jgi:iron complex outermembrane recepter protein
MSGANRSAARGWLAAVRTVARVAGGLTLLALASGAALAVLGSLARQASAQPAQPGPPASAPAPATHSAPADPPGPSSPPDPPAPPGPPAPPRSSTLGTLTGTVVSQDLDAPLAGAVISLVTSHGPIERARTGDDGRFELELPPGEVVVRAELDGFRTVELTVRIALGKPAMLELPLPLSQALTEVIVVVGSRTPRTNVETPVAVDVITADEIARSGQIETARVLNALAPSFIAKPQSIADGTDHIDPASLRGLGPDQLLVLINGKRRHQSALLNVNSTFGRGTVGVDLSSIPAAAIKRIEILRDGAASQYGSDAISGVINIVLKETTDVVAIDTLAGVTGEGDGRRFSTSVNYGFRLGDKGFINVTGQLIDRGATNRAGDYTGPVFTPDGNVVPEGGGPSPDDLELRNRGLSRKDLDMRIGEAAASVGMIAYNLELPLAAGATFYSFGGITRRNGEAAGYYRYPYQEAQNVPELFDHGFLPEIHSDLIDVSIGGGLRGTKAGWLMDLSLVHGANSFQFNVENSVNASLGTASPTTFDAGTLRFSQTVGNLDLLRKLDPGPLSSLSFVGGAEFRAENYSISAGDLPSWQIGTSTTAGGVPRVPGAQVFPGFRPENEVDRSRNNMGAYVGLESQLSRRAMFDIGGRFERYSDFGDSLIGKASGRFAIRRDLALRGAISTGFRAPSLHQLWFSTIATNFINNASTGALEATQVLTSNNASPITRAFGIPELRDERSRSLSLGMTFRPIEGLSVTADGYLIDIEDRIVLAGRFTTALDEVAKILAPFPSVTAAQFFVNGLDTSTRGVDVVVDYTRQLGAATLTLTASANVTHTEVDEIKVPGSLAKKFGDTDQLRTAFFGRGEENRIETALPRQKGLASARYTRGAISAMLRANYYGPVFLRPDLPENDERFGGKVLFDAEAGYQLTRRIRLTVGAENFLNTFPDAQQKPANVSDGRFVYSNLGQFGLNGGFYYAKLSLVFF